jgi:hypothetical protein
MDTPSRLETIYSAPEGVLCWLCRSTRLGSPEPDPSFAKCYEPGGFYDLDFVCLNCATAISALEGMDAGARAGFSAYSGSAREPRTEPRPTPPPKNQGSPAERFARTTSRPQPFPLASRPFPFLSRLSGVSRSGTQLASVHSHPAETLPSSFVRTETLAEPSSPSEIPTVAIPGGLTYAPPQSLPASSRHWIRSPGSTTPAGNVLLSPR